MPNFEEIAGWLDCQMADVPAKDSPRAVNGLQVAGDGRNVRLIAAAVDACEASIHAAVDARAGILLVHHGLFWQGVQPVRDAVYRKFRLLLDSGLALYSMHLPLDAHPVLGNNVQLCRALGFGDGEPWFELEGCMVGRMVHMDLNREEVVALVEKALGGRVHVCPGGPKRVRQMGIVTGAAGAEVAAASAQGVDTFLTGEAPHWAYTLAEDLGVNLLLGGHYATETFGVKALAEAASKHFDLPWVFLDHPTGL